jgi:hypothetical protein
MPEQTPRESLYAKYSQLEQRAKTRRLSRDQEQSLRYFRAERLVRQEPGQVADSRDYVTRWARNVLALEAFVEKEERMPRENNRLPVEAFATDEVRLATWVRYERRSRDSGRRSSYQLERLDLIAGYSRRPLAERWDKRRADYAAFIATNLRAPLLQDSDERSLAAWAAKQRYLKRRGRLESQKQDSLNQLGIWTWGKRLEGDGSSVDR